MCVRACVCACIVGRKVSSGWHGGQAEWARDMSNEGESLDVFVCAGVGAWMGGGHVRWVQPLVSP